MDSIYLELAYKEALEAYNIDEVPVGCVIVKDNNILSSAHNEKEKYNDVTCHAEILAIREASKILGDWRLNGCVLYSTVKPCPMCIGAIRESRISRVVYIVDSVDNKKYYTKLSVIQNKQMFDKNLKLLQSFFSEKR